MTDFRTETDSLGPKQLPRDAVWGIHTARALIGPKNPVDALAGQAGTIGYEILTSLGGRYAHGYADAPQNERLTA
jgi:hypothetical protein